MLKSLYEKSFFIASLVDPGPWQWACSHRTFDFSGGGKFVAGHCWVFLIFYSMGHWYFYLFRFVPEFYKTLWNFILRQRFISFTTEHVVRNSVAETQFLLCNEASEEFTTFEFLRNLYLCGNARTPLLKQALEWRIQPQTKMAREQIYSSSLHRSSGNAAKDRPF